MDLPFNIYAFFRDTSLVLLSWFLLSTSFFSWGKLLRKILNIEISGKKGIIATIWLGFVFCILFFSVYNLFLPVNVFASSIFYIPSIIYFFVKYGKKLHAFFSSIGRLKIVVIILTLFAASAVAIQMPFNLDTGFYHLNSIRWVNEYHIIKGLGNLHDKLGFNQLFFVYSASLNFHPFLNDYAFRVSNSFLYALFFVGMIFNNTFIDVLLVGLFFFIPMPYYWINCPTPDITSTLIQIVIFRYFIDIVYYLNEKSKIDLIAFIAILSILLMTVKLSNGLLVLGLFGLILLFLYKKYSLNNIEKKKALKAFIFICLFFGIWVVRGYIQTGYPFFPSSFGRIQFDWTVPDIIAKTVTNYIYASSRSCERTFVIDSPLIQDYKWVDYWFKKNFFDKEKIFKDSLAYNISVSILLLLFPFTMDNWGFGSLVMLVLSGIFLLLWMFRCFKNKEIFYKSYMLFYLFIIEFLSLSFVFYMAPYPRFTNGCFIMLFVTGVLLLKSAYNQIKVKKDIKQALLFYSLIMFVWNFYNSYADNEFAINGMFVVGKAEMEEYTTKYGLKVLVPVNGAVEIWDSALPATPNRLSKLSLRGDSISDGFCIKGEIKGIIVAR